MPEKKKPGLIERSRRRAGVATAGKTGLGANLKRGFAMIGALARETIAPTENMPSREQVRSYHERKVSEKKAAKAKKGQAAMKKSEPVRKKAEQATGVSRVTNPLRALEALTRKAKKD